MKISINKRKLRTRALAILLITNWVQPIHPFPIMKALPTTYQTFSAGEHITVSSDNEESNKNLVSNRGGAIEQKKKWHQSSGFVAAVVFSLTSILAHANLLPNHGYSNNQEIKNAIYPQTDIERDQIACIITFLGATGFVKGCTYACKHNIIESSDTRKIIHTFSGVLFMLCWPLFSKQYAARFFAASIMIVFNFRLWTAGQNKASNTNEMNDLVDEERTQNELELANAISRSGEAKEALEGPLLYGFIVLIGTVAFWRDNLIGVIAISILAAGDGAADLIGRRFSANNKWPFPALNDKSIVGSLAFFISSFLVSIGVSLMMMYTDSLNHEYTMSFRQFLLRVAIICLLSAVIELLPFGNDNLNVPLFAAFLSKVLLS